MLSSQCFGYLILLDLDFFFFWFSYGDYSFGRALKTTVGRREGEAAGLKDRIKQGGAVVYKRWRNGDRDVQLVRKHSLSLLPSPLFMAEGQDK